MSRKRRWTTEAAAEILANSESSSDSSDVEDSVSYSNESEEEESEDCRPTSEWRFIDDKSGTTRKDPLPDFIGTPGLNPSINIPDNVSNDPIFLLISSYVMSYMSTFNIVQIQELGKKPRNISAKRMTHFLIVGLLPILGMSQSTNLRNLSASFYTLG